MSVRRTCGVVAAGVAASLVSIAGGGGPARATAPAARSAPVSASASASAFPAVAAEPCQVPIGAINDRGDHVLRVIRATRPPSAFDPRTVMRDVHPDGVVTIAARANPYPTDPHGGEVLQWVVRGDALYHARYETHEGGDGTLDPGDPELTRIGGGWGAMRAIEVSGYAHEPAATAKLYALGKDGSLYRWNRAGAGWTGRQVAPGFSAVRATALARHDATSDTFLMTTNGGALYSVRIPFTTLAPQVRVIRSRTWQIFETLVAEPCGRSGALLAGIDRATGDTYLYAIGALNGTSTVISGLGRANGSSTEPVLFTWGRSPIEG